MFEFNTVLGVAKLVGEPKYFKAEATSGKPGFEKMSVRVVENSFYRKDDLPVKSAVFFNLIYYGSLSEAFKKSLTKNARVTYKGSMSLRPYTKDIGGQSVKFEVLEIKCIDICPHDDKPDGYRAPTTAESAAPQTLSEIPASGFEDTFGNEGDENVAL